MSCDVPRIMCLVEFIFRRKAWSKNGTFIICTKIPMCSKYESVPNTENTKEKLLIYFTQIFHVTWVSRSLRGICLLRNCEIEVSRCVAKIP